jgi:hypothetical protein
MYNHVFSSSLVFKNLHWEPNLDHLDQIFIGSTLVHAKAWNFNDFFLMKRFIFPLGVSKSCASIDDPYIHKKSLFIKQCLLEYILYFFFQFYFVFLISSVCHLNWLNKGLFNCGIINAS